jgi:hypothetical protein
MSDQTSARLGLPLLQVAQAQKEITHNEALTLLDLATQAVVEAVGRNVPPDAPAAGACWIVGGTPSGPWAGQAQALAGWTDGGWRFVAARAGMAVWSQADGAMARFDGAAWSIGTLAGTRLVLGGASILAARQPAIAAPASGTTVDAEGRAAISAIIFTLRTHGLIAP